MRRFLILFGLPVTAVIVFFSGSLPHTLIYDEESLQDVKFTGDAPVTVELKGCEIEDTGRLARGATLDTTFNATFKNHTNRYIVISAIGEVFDPGARSMGMNSQLLVLNPDAVEKTTFRSLTPFTIAGTYTCEMRYAIGRFKY